MKIYSPFFFYVKPQTYFKLSQLSLVLLNTQSFILLGSRKNGQNEEKKKNHYKAIGEKKSIPIHFLFFAVSLLNLSDFKRKNRSNIVNKNFDPWRYFS